MKKIIALAITGAFVTPAFAAEVTISGDMEYKYYKTKDDGIQTSLDGDSDFFIAATEELDNGMTVTYKVGFEDVSNLAVSDGDSELHLSGTFGKVMLGEVDGAAELYDEYSHVAEDGGASGIIAGQASDSTITWELPAMVDGLSVAVSGSIVNGSTANSDDEEMDTAVGIKYSVGNLTATYGSIDIEGEAYSPSAFGAQFSFGAITVAAEIANEVGAATTDKSTFGVTYNYGPGKFFYEANKEDANGTETDIDIMGVSYKLGGAVNLYAQTLSHTTNTSDSTTVGVEYSF